MTGQMTLSPATEKAAKQAAKLAAEQAYINTIAKAQNKGKSAGMKQVTTPISKQEFLGNSEFTEFEMSHSEKMLNAFVDKCDVDGNIAGMMRHVFSPKSHEDHLSFTDASNLYFPGEKIGSVKYRFNAACSSIVQNLLFGQKMREEKNLLPEKTISEGKRSYTRLSKEEKKANEIRKAKIKEIKASLGIGARGRISEEKQEAFNEALAAWEAAN